MTLWQSAEAARGWGDNPDYVQMREQEIQPSITAWSITPATIEAADLRNIVV